MITHHLMSGGDAQRTSDAPNVIQPRVNSLNFPGFTETLSLMRWMVTRTTGPSANVSICFPGDAWLDGWMDGWTRLSFGSAPGKLHCHGMPPRASAGRLQ